MDQQGTQQVSISGLDDKRQITLLLSVTKAGTLLPPQLIYAGKTNRCLPKGVNFPESWDITYTESHWSNEETMIQYANNVIIPYIEDIRESLPLTRGNQSAITIFDVFLDHLKKHDIIPLFVPAACTDKLQSLDLSVNDSTKKNSRHTFTTGTHLRYPDH
ncbi:uncharacterized protein [Palaemon carinicauda]|uniref:uncharacterized protein n=1 Tax=Palaemon carinicauda TaxID=392227 RepID=UPI0035B5A8D5